MLVLAKSEPKLRVAAGSNNIWQCPVTGTTLVNHADLYYAPEVGLAYPVLRSVPLLRAEHVVVASQLSSANAQ